jgi:hypothetical protein
MNEITDKYLDDLVKSTENEHAGAYAGIMIDESLSKEYLIAIIKSLGQQIHAERKDHSQSMDFLSMLRHNK